MGVATTRRELMLAAGGAFAALGALAGCAPGRAPGGPSSAALDACEEALGVDYTPAERHQMLAAVADQLEAVRVLRALERPNALAPALVFDPRLPGQDYAAPQQGLRGAPGARRPRPSAEADIAFAPAWMQAVWLREGALTSAELTEIYLARLAQYDPALRCMVAMTPERARAEAAAADAARAAGRDLGPLHGLPYVLKDLFDAEGAPSTWGAATRRDAPPADRDCAVAARLKAGGAVLLGKASLGALAYGDIWFGGVTRNPWSLEEGSSGSSAGPAAAVAAGLASFAIGSETMGSLVSPAHRCGATGLRPTFGRVSRAGAMALCWSLDKVGPLTRASADAALVLSVLNGADAGDPASLDAPFGADLSAEARGLRVGYDPAWYEDANHLDVEARDALLDAGAELIERPVPAQPTDSLALGLLVEAAAAFEELTLTNADDQLTWQDDEAWPNTFRATRFVSAIDYVQADRARRQAMSDMHDAFEGLDAMVGPNFAGGMLNITNFTGHPQMALRAGFIDTPPRTLFGAPRDPAAASVRVPYASSLWAPLLREDTLVTLARAVEARLGVADERPPLTS